MPKITETEIAAAYALAREVRAGHTVERDAADQLAVELGMDRGSAAGYVRQLSHFLDGKTYTRTINDAATRYYLERILADDGPVGLAQALTALSGHISYYEGKASARPSLHAIRDEFAALIAKASTEADVDAQADALLLSGQAVSKPQVLGNGLPAQSLQQVTVFKRSAAVAAYVRQRANGHCEDCGNPAPFLKKSSGLPYLEVHHKKRLADKGPDTVENALALCPNCHRKAHFG